MGNDRVSVPPTRLSLQLFKQRLVAATRGHLILKKKADALTNKLRILLKIVRDQKLKLEGLSKNALISLSAAKFSVPDANFRDVLIESVSSATYQLRPATAANSEVAQLKASISFSPSVALSIYQPFVSDQQSRGFTGLGQGGTKIRVCRENYSRLLELIVNIAATQTFFMTLEHIIKATNRRVNAIEHIIKPKIVDTIEAIELELEEAEREETFRLKRLQQIKGAAIEAEKAARKIHNSSPAPVTVIPNHVNDETDLIVF